MRREDQRREMSHDVWVFMWLTLLERLVTARQRASASNRTSEIGSIPLDSDPPPFKPNPL
jgi:hypothetical protein